jgi:hypothetical protein
MPPTQMPTFDYLDPRLWTGVVNQIPVPDNYIGDGLLPSKDVPGDRLMWDIFTAENPIAPMVSIDAESPRMDDEQIATAWADIVYTRYKRVLKESDLRWIRSFGMPPIVNIGQGMDLMRRAAMQRISDDAARLKKAVQTRREQMQISSLLGALTVTPQSADNKQSNVQFTLTYPVQTVTPATLWSDTVNADPVQDIQNWFLNIFYTPTTMIANRQVWLNLARNAKLLRLVGAYAGFGAGALPTAVPEQRIFDFLSAQFGLRGIVYTAQYTTRVDSGIAYTPARVKMLPDNKVIILPTEKVGYTATAPAPQNNYQTGDFSWVVTPEQGGRMDPYVYEMGVGWYGLPVIEQPFKVIVATVA